MLNRRPLPQPCPPRGGVVAKKGLMFENFSALTFFFQLAFGRVMEFTAVFISRGVTRNQVYSLFSLLFRLYPLFFPTANPLLPRVFLADHQAEENGRLLTRNSSSAVLCGVVFYNSFFFFTADT